MASLLENTDSEDKIASFLSENELITPTDI